MKKALLIFLILLIIGGTTYAIYYQVDRFNKETNVKETKEEIKKEEKEELDVDSEEVTNLMKNFNVVNDYFNFLSSSNRDKMGYFYLKDSYLKNEISDDVKLMIAMNSVELKRDQTCEARGQQWNCDIISAEEVRNYIKQIFGDDVSYNDEATNNISNCFMGDVIFDQSTNNYTFIANDGCGGTLNPFYETIITKATKYKDRLEIIEKPIYIEANIENDITFNIYKGNKKDLIAENIEDIMNKLYDNPDTESKTLKKDSPYFEKTDAYRYTFKIKNSNYYFEKVEKIK